MRSSLRGLVVSAPGYEPKGHGFDSRLRHLVNIVFQSKCELSSNNSLSHQPPLHLCCKTSITGARESWKVFPCNLHPLTTIHIYFIHEIVMREEHEESKGFQNIFMVYFQQFLIVGHHYYDVRTHLFSVSEVQSQLRIFEKDGSGNDCQLSINGKLLEHMNDFVYLGRMFCNNGMTDGETDKQTPREQACALFQAPFDQIGPLSRIRELVFGHPYEERHLRILTGLQQGGRIRRQEALLSATGGLHHWGILDQRVPPPLLSTETFAR
uniref:(California timema) hypothetical protein n=1 Tax=Timema californicum TaxID=61474 RepID=A0A7R9J570_TIMCA|nr:unnamed protein product [Timema californicum]